MSNPRTTIAGYAMLAASLLTVLAHALTGELSTADISLAFTALGGLGLVWAKDGGH